ncbi:YitT family protein [Erwiniaceae bacterium BAC15a-03b]|uniref:YitT family protein n=1 Tax=Winslowiella arboricola TaxID=2978220 RepID=A0A9J6PKR9_9GAMM|nr:YitT family protein [Winslowiella arboricola]MCU5774628.1 YitT family protein [Winslowiella arboricola]MCU5777962.1 YitT family protein [Winslowiella arboricola]
MREENSKAGMMVPSISHTTADDVYGLALGVMFISIGLNMLHFSGMVTGGVAGIALLLSYFVDMKIGTLFILVNLPFMAFSWWKMGGAFTFKTLMVNFALMAASLVIPDLLKIDYIHPVFSSLVGGTIIGMGILCLARHNASVGGTGVITLWGQKVYGVNAGKTQMLLDVVVFVIALAKVPGNLLLWSVLSAVAMNAMLLRWHKPGRYSGA